MLARCPARHRTAGRPLARSLARSLAPTGNLLAAAARSGSKASRVLRVIATTLSAIPVLKQQPPQQPHPAPAHPSAMHRFHPARGATAAADDLADVDSAAAAAPTLAPVNVPRMSLFKRGIKVFFAVILGAIMLYLLYSLLLRPTERTERAAAEDTTGASGGSAAPGGWLKTTLASLLGIPVAKAAANTRGAQGGAPGAPAADGDKGNYDLSPEDALALAKRLRAAGFQIKGQSWCPATQAQRALFGPRDWEARKEIEAIYTECRGPGVCPNVKSIPAWESGNRQFVGFQSAARLHKMCDEMEQTPKKAMIQAAADPQDADEPDTANGEDNPAMPQDLPPDQAKAMLLRMLRDIDANQKATNMADQIAATADAGAAEGGGSSCQDDEGQDAEALVAEGARRELARGVSAYAPLNVPDMPGTAPMALNVNHHDHQMMQGNIPRVGTSGHQPTEPLMRQLVASFANLQQEAATRAPMNSTYSQTRDAHSRSITTGEAFTPKSLLEVTPHNSKGQD